MFSEAVILIQGLGIQLQKVHYSGLVQVRFVPRDKIKEIVVNEGITGCRVIFYLAVVLGDHEEMELAFTVSMPQTTAPRCVTL